MYYVLIIYSLLIFFHKDPMYYNLTKLSTLPYFKFIVYIFIVLSVFYLLIKIKSIYKSLPIETKRYQNICLISSLMMMIGPLFPYNDLYPIYSLIHLILSFFGCAITILLLIHINRLLSIHYTNIYLKSNPYFEKTLQFIIIIFIVFANANGYVELFTYLFVITYIYIINKEICEKE